MPLSGRKLFLFVLSLIRLFLLLKRRVVPRYSEVPYKDHKPDNYTVQEFCQASLLCYVREIWESSLKRTMAQ